MLDYDTLRANRLASQGPGLSDWAERERQIVDAARAEYREQREREQQDAEMASAIAWCERKSAAASRANDPGDTALWTRAAATLREGRWPVSRRVGSAPDVTLHQACRTRLLYDGKGVRIDD